MTLCLRECLRVVGLQHHYARFTSAGIYHAAQISALTMEDYPSVGVCSMEDRTQLFHLIQMIKSLDLESLEHEDWDDYECNAHGADLRYEDRSFAHDACENPKDKDAANFSKSRCVSRRLDFSSESINRCQKLSSHLLGDVNDEPGQCKGSALPVQVYCKTGSAAVCSCKGNNSPVVLSHGSDYHTGGNMKPDISEEISMSNCHIGLSPKPKHRPAVVASKWVKNKPVGYKGKGAQKVGKIQKGTSWDRNSEQIYQPTPVYELKRTTGYNYGLPLSSPSAPNTNCRQPGVQRISVCVRKRPQTRAECRRGESDVVSALSGDCVIVHESKEAVDLTQYILQHRFYFDHVFGEESSNEDVYRKTVFPLVQHMLNGGTATCFAYGQTGAGKTHTMLGSSPSTPGLYALAVKDIFAQLSTTHTHSSFLVYVSFFEIYCGQLYDLLDHRKRLFAREDGQKMVHIAGLRDVRVDSVSSLLEVIEEGTEERTRGMSGVNPLSSRSHALLQIQLKGPNQQEAGGMWFVDLAGSERASDTKEPDRQSRMEGAEINQSLLALKECIRSLDQEQPHTPFRQSKLTQVLKNSFIGDSMTCMIANISPGHLATEHTLNTLRYADRVKELKEQGGRKGGRRERKTSSPKCNFSNSTNSSRSSGGSGFGIRGKSPKKPKLGRQRNSYGATAPTGDPVLCSTPQNSRWKEETSTSARKGIRFEQITPVKGLMKVSERSEKVCGTGGRRKERFGQSDNVIIRESNNQSLLNEGRERERRLIGQRRRFESNSESFSEIERLMLADLHEADDRDKEREMRLRQYHQQLQQFMPSSASSSIHLLSTPTCPSFSSSIAASLSSSVSQSPPSPISCLPVSVPVHQGLEEVLDAYRARVEVRSDGNRLQCPYVSSAEAASQTKTSPWYTQRKSEVGVGDTVGGDARVRREDLRPAWIEEEEGTGRRWAWVATAETEQTGGMTGASPAAVEAQMHYNCDSEESAEVGVEGLDTADIPANAVWSTEENESNDRRSLFDHTAVESSHQHAPAERPLSPGCKHTLTLLTPDNLSELPLRLNHARCTSDDLNLPLPNVQMSMPSSSHREDAKANANRRQFSNFHSAVLTHTTPNAQGFKKLSENLNSLPQEDTPSGPYSQIMDPLSISLLQVDQLAATALCFTGELGNSSAACVLDKRSRDDNRRIEGKEQLAYKEIARQAVEEVDVEFLSLSAMAKSKRHFQPTSNTIKTSTTERRTDNGLATHELCELDCPGLMKLPIPGFIQTSVQDQENNHRPQTRPAIDVLGSKATSSLQNSPKYASSMQTSFSVQSSTHTSLPISHSTVSNEDTDRLSHNKHIKPAFSVLKTPSYSVLGNSLQQNNPIESDIIGINSKQETRNNSSLPVLEEVVQTQWRVVQAHWEQLEEMEALWQKEGTLLCQYPDMAFEEYVHKLEEIMERKSKCVHNMIARLQIYRKPSHNQTNEHGQGQDNRKLNF